MLFLKVVQRHIQTKKMEQTTIYLIIWLMQLLVITSLWYSVAKSEGTFEYFAEKIEEMFAQ